MGGTVWWSLAACIENGLVKDDPTAAAVAAEIAVTPASVDFGVVPPGDAAFAVVDIANVGGATLSLEPVALVAGDAALSVADPAPGALEPGESVQVQLQWQPVDAALADVLRVGSDDPERPVIDVPVSGRLPEPDIQVVPEDLSFGELALGASATATVEVRNVGAGALRVTGLDWAAPDPDLSVVDAGALSSLPATLAPGDAVDVSVRFAPHSYGTHLGTLAVASDDPDEPSAEVAVSGTSTDPCAGYTQTVELTLTADDAWEGWMDGVGFGAPGSGSWSTLDTVTFELGCGPHALAIYATDQALAVSGVLAAVQVEGVTTFVSGPDHWKITDVPPPADWTDVFFDDSGWNVPQVCADTSLWGTAPAPLYAEGASWIWWTSECTSLGQAWLRLNFTVP